MNTLHFVRSIALIPVLAMNNGVKADDPLDYGSGYEADDVVSGSLDEVITANSTNDYLCGSLILQLTSGWFIQSLFLKHGTIQNQFQFEPVSGGKKRFRPTGFGNTLLHVRQPTGYLAYSNLYPSGYPIDFLLTVVQAGGVNETSFRIRKKTCNIAALGEVELSQLTGNPLSYHLQNSERDDTTTIFHWFDSAFFTPAYLVMPAPQASDGVFYP